MGRWKPQSQHRKAETMESPWEGGNHRVNMGRCRNHRVTMGRWKLWSLHRRVETMESPWEGGNHVAPWSHDTGGNHRVTMVSPWEGGNHKVTTGR